MAHEFVHQKRRAGVNFGLPVGVETGNLFQVILHGLRQGVELFGGSQKLEKTVFGFCPFLRIITIQAVQTSPGMGVN